MNLLRMFLLLGCLFSGLAAPPVHAQVVTFIGDPEAISSGPFETPFPTGSASSSRTQYLFLQSEVAAAGLPAGQGILGVVIELLDSDPVNTLVHCYVQMKNVITSDMVNFDYAGLQLCEDIAGLNLQSGMLSLQFNVSPFQWNGVDNLLVGFAIERSGPTGVDPRVMLDTSFAWSPTYYAQDTAPLPALSLSSVTGLYSAPFDSRPVMGFIVPGTSSFASEAADDVQVVLYPVPAADRLQLRLLNAPSLVRARIVNATGSLVRSIEDLDANGTISIPLVGLDQGCYVLCLIDQQGRQLVRRTFMVE